MTEESQTTYGGAGKSAGGADEQAAIVPLLAVGASLIHYLALDLIASPVLDINGAPIMPPGVLSARYGLPLAFVAVAVAHSRRRQHDPAAAQDSRDALVIAVVVFVLVSIVSSPATVALPARDRLVPSLLYLPSVLGLGALAWRRHSALLTRWTTVTAAGLIVGTLVQTHLLSVNGYFVSTGQLVRLVTAAALVVAACRYYLAARHTALRLPDPGQE